MSDEELTKLESALKSKDENTITEITISHTSEERYKIREAYKIQINNFFKSPPISFSTTLIKVFE